MKNYRALISIPLEASSDGAAITVANEQAASLVGTGGAVVGHVEFVGEVRHDDLMEMSRIVISDPMFLSQLPPDWQP